MKVALIATGVMELRGLAGALRRLFPQHDFRSVPLHPARPGVEAEPFPQSNTYRVSDAPREGLRSNRTKLVEALAGEVFPPDRRDAMDLALVLDDLELFNIDQPGAVLEAVRACVREHLERQRQRNPHDARELAICLRERASFHLAVPMTESWLFADPSGPTNSGAPTAQVRLRAGIDPEAFETDDPAYSVDDGSGCMRLLDRNLRRRESRQPPWQIAPQPGLPWFTRERHPKAYLQWLCRDPRENSCTRWQESKQGSEALEALDWRSALSTSTQCTWLRALVDDLADGLGELLEFPGATGGLSPLTARKRDDPSAVLRNL